MILGWICVWLLPSFIALHWAVPRSTLFSGIDFWPGQQVGR